MYTADRLALRCREFRGHFTDVVYHRSCPEVSAVGSTVLGLSDRSLRSSFAWRHAYAT